MSASHDGALTLPVSDLHAATSFYVSALQPLDYCHISTGSHQTSWGSSQTVGLGPAGTSRVDLFLSQSDQPTRRKTRSSSAQVVFPATSRVSVRDAYAAALNAGGRSVSAPQYDDDAGVPAVFAAVVTDLDRNKLRIEFEEGVMRENWNGHGRGSSSGLISQWPSNTGQASAEKLRSTNNSTHRGSIADLSEQAIGVIPREEEGNRVRETSASHSPKYIGKGVVGAIIGAAAGAALAYTMVASQQDSKERERDFSSRMMARDRVKTEAWGSPPQHEARSWYIAPRRRSSEMRRDSGYWSFNERGQSFSYQGNSRSYAESRPRTRRSASVTVRDRKYIEWDPSVASKDSHRNVRRNSINYDVGTTGSQSRSQFGRPARESASLAPPSSTSRWKEFFRPPAPPKKPSAPWNPSVMSSSARERRSSSPAELNRSTICRSSTLHSTTRKATEAGRAAAASTVSRKSNGTAIRTALPPSTAPSSTNTIRTKDDLPGSIPVNSEGAKLTASSLAAHNIPLPESSVGGGSFIDDLETVMPDDSISSVGISNKARSSTSKHSRR